MSDNIDEEVNYIYLLQEREFIKTKENIYKAGMTKKNNFERFNQYPKGSVLLFQMICKNCNDVEKEVLKIFKEHFKQRKDIGNEYFEGDYKEMIDIIYNIIKGESEEVNEDNVNEEIYIIRTYEEWIKYNKINGIVITNKNGEGYIKLKNEAWRVLYDKYNPEYDNTKMECLSDFVENRKALIYKMIKPNSCLVSMNERKKMEDEYNKNMVNLIISGEKEINNEKMEEYVKECYKFIHVEYDVDKIVKDIIKKCNNKNPEFYNLNYNEYLISKCNGVSNVEYVIFNSNECTFTPVDELISNKILTEDNSSIKPIIIKDNINIKIVDDILDVLIDNKKKVEYKKLVYNLIVKQEEEIVFYDYYPDCLLSEWIKDLLYTIGGNKIYVYVYADDYYDDKNKFRCLIKKNNPRLVIIRKLNGREGIPIRTQINDFLKLGFKNIIIRDRDEKYKIYNIDNYHKYLNDNKKMLMELIKSENDYEITNWDNETSYDDNIFSKQHLLLTNYLKWCCTK